MNDKLMKKIIDIFGIDKERWLFCSDADLKENGYWMEKDPYDCACCIAKDEDGWLKKNCHCICHKRINRLAKSIFSLLTSEVEKGYRKGFNDAMTGEFHAYDGLVISSGLQPKRK